MIIQSIRKGKFGKVLASYLSIQLLLQVVQPTAMWALTGGPKQPEFNSFTPIGTSDMVDLASGDFSYNIPIMDVGGYPLNLSYQSGVTMDQEASWVGLGWNLNVGQINRQVRGIPDDFKGDEMIYENYLKKDATIGSNFSVPISLFGADKAIGVGLNLGLGVEYNNYNGLSFRPSFGVSFGFNDTVSLGMNISSSAGEGVTVSPNIGISAKTKENDANVVRSVSTGIGIGLNSRKGLENLSLSTSLASGAKNDKTNKFVNLGVNEKGNRAGGSFSGSIDFNDQNNYTPSKRVGMHSENITFSASLAGTVFGFQVQGSFTGYGAYQRIKNSEIRKASPAFGYQHTDLAESSNGVLDFTRENERTISPRTRVLPVTNYTYDTYAIQGQGISGQFRPYRSQVGYVYDPLVEDSSSGYTIGGEFGAGQTFFAGLEVKNTRTSVASKKWVRRNQALPYFKEALEEEQSKDYEKVYFKNIGELSSDIEGENLIYNKLIGEKPIRFGVNGGRYTKSLVPQYNSIFPGENAVQSSISPEINSNLKRNNRDLRNQNIQIYTSETAVNEPFINSRSNDGFIKPHLTVGAKILKTDGSTYIYGESAFNTKKVEATFDVSRHQGDCSTGLVNYNSTISNGIHTITGNNSNTSNQYLNRVTTPAYAHTFLLSSILSADYEDLPGEGEGEISDNDLGSYTKFLYTSPLQYKWRVPFQSNEASFNAGLNANENDQTANYVYGEKELKYIKEIETKTHIAVFEISPRKDAAGVIGESGGLGAGRMQQLDKIYLFSKPEYKEMRAKGNYNQQKDKKAIKIAHFDYDYSLCDGGNGVVNSTNNSGKLTLKKVYFTYRDSFMGKYTPYTFEYHLNDVNGNPYKYNLKSYDIWGNYKENLTPSNCEESNVASPQEFPFVEQSKAIADSNIKAWNISTIGLPSGGKIKLEVESDDYQFVQEKRAMQMFKVVGAGNSNIGPDSENFSNELYGNKYLYVKVSDSKLQGEALNKFSETFKKKYLDNNIEDPIYFRFLLNMTNIDYDYVEGYFKLDGEPSVFPKNSGTYAAIPMTFLKLEGGIFSGNAGFENPISKAGWHFGRTYLNKVVYGGDKNPNVDDLESAVRNLVGAFPQLLELFKGPNLVLKGKKVANNFIPHKSWIRLQEPTGKKLGGGLRVKKLKMLDHWDAMSNQSISYKQEYGQEYSYSLDNGSSSGVAAYEPNGSKENPLVKPFFNKNGSNFADKIASPKTANYSEKPFGKAFFPSAKITYSKVTVKNLEREVLGERRVKSHATGKVVSEFYTTKDFPTIANFTDINQNGYDPAKKLSKFLRFNVRSHITLAQGFSVVTNDMDGKQKAQWVFQEGSPSAISGVEYKYNVKTGAPKELDNTFKTINEKGEISDQLMGQNYDVVNDFKENYSNTVVSGVNSNLTMFLAAVWPVFVPVPLPNYAEHENILRLATTTKVIHKTGVLKEKIAYDLGASVSTKNLAWDANTGQVLLTETDNEYGEKYYNLTYPAYWAYKGMGFASDNIGVKGKLVVGDAEDKFFKPESDNPQEDYKYLNVGDELLVNSGSISTRLWIVEANPDLGITLMNKSGEVVNFYECSGPSISKYDPLNYEIVRSAFRNQQLTSMGSITMKKNPLLDTSGSPISTLTNHDKSYNVVNASFVEYSDFWIPQKEEDLPKFSLGLKSFFEKQNKSGYLNKSENEFRPQGYGFNPFVYNVKGDFRAIKSHAFLRERNTLHEDNSNVKLNNVGFFKHYTSFYLLNASGGYWSRNFNWTSASEITKYNPYGVEVENKDALGRYSSAQYGYNYTLPTAVASNSGYNEIGFDGFEDYYNNLDNSDKKHFGFNLTNVNTNSIVITDQQSHSGKYSIEVGANKSVALNRGLGKCDPKIEGCFNYKDPIFIKQDIKYIPEDIIQDSDATGASIKFTVKGAPYQTFSMYALVQRVGLSLNYNGPYKNAQIRLYEDYFEGRAPLIGAGVNTKSQYNDNNCSIEGGEGDTSGRDYRKATYTLDENGALDFSFTLEVGLCTEYHYNFLWDIIIGDNINSGNTITAEEKYLRGYSQN